MADPACPTCRARIREHEASRCLDAWVVVAVMGWRRVEHDWPKSTKVQDSHHRIEWYPPGKEEGPGRAGAGLHAARIPHYSTDIAAAWQVVEKMIETNEMILCFSAVPEYGEWWSVEFLPFKRAHIANRDDEGEAAEAAPLAICRVAIIALEGEPCDHNEDAKD